MAKHKLTTVEDLRNAFQYLVTEISLKASPVFDPNDEANWYDYPLNIAVLIRDTFDLAAALREAKLARSILERTLTYHREFSNAEVRSPYGILAIFPSGLIPADGPTEVKVQDFFKKEQILALFTPPA